MNRLIAIGDIHGHLNKLNLLLTKVQPTSDDQLVFLGDYIDRGPESCGVIERLLKLQKEFPRTVFLRGNHEQMLLDALVETGAINGKRLRETSNSFAAGAVASDLQMFMLNGGRATLDSYGMDDLGQGLPGEHIAFLMGTRLWWRQGAFVFVHAGLTPGAALENQDKETLLWARHEPPGQGGEIHVVGHHPTLNRQPLFEEGRYSLDTGAGYGHPLTACDVLTQQVWQML